MANKFHALTISPPERLHYTSQRYLAGRDLKFIQFNLNRASKHYMIVPEFTPLTSRLHYHGVVRIDDIVKWHKSTMSRLKALGFVKLDPIKDNKNHIRWLCYILKEWHLTCKILRIKRPLMYTSVKLSSPIPPPTQAEEVKKTLYDYFEGRIDTLPEYYN